MISAQETETTKDAINQPNHYRWHPVCECIKIVQEFPYNLGVAIAYIWRAEHKDSKIEDLQKAIKHLEFEIERAKSCL